MKKLLSIILSAVMLISVGMATVPAFAIVGSQESTTSVVHNKIIPQVNGKSTNDIDYEWISDSPKTIKFTYNGDGTVTGWEFGSLKEGKDYKIVAQDDNSITIELLDQSYTGDITVNAIVDEGEKEETTKVPVSKNTSKTSPKTGAVAAAGIAAMGAGVAVLAAAKKKKED